jgi:hypothetical protein
MLKDIAYVTRRRQDTINCTFQGSIYSPDESLYVTGSSKTLTIYSKDGSLGTQLRKHDYDGLYRLCRNSGATVVSALLLHRVRRHRLGL